MSQQHLVTHAYDSHTGWVRVPRIEMTSQNAQDLRARGFTMVRFRRGMFGFRDVSIRRYLADAPSMIDPEPTVTASSPPGGDAAEEFFVDLVPASPPVRS